MKHKVKIDGQDLEVPYEELVKGYQTGKVSTQRLQQASELKKQVDGVIGGLKAGERQKFEEMLGGKQKLREWAENFLLEDLEYEKLSPAEKKARELEAENRSLKAEREAEKKKLEDEQMAQLRDKASKELESEIEQALSELGKKPTTRLVMRILDEIQARLESKGQRITGKEAFTKAMGGIHQDISEYLDGMPVEQALKILPKSLVDGLRKYEVSQVIGETKSIRQPAAAQKSSKGPQKVGVDQWFDNLDKKIKRS
jgi:hypothetical protein